MQLKTNTKDLSALLLQVKNNTDDVIWGENNCVDHDLNQRIYTSSIFAALPLIMLPKLWNSVSVKMVKSPETFQLMK